MKLFRVLFPAWRFFTEVTDLPVLYLRTASLSGEFGPWILGLQNPQRKPWSFLFNPEGNLYLAYNSLLQQLESDVGDLKAEEVSRFEESPSFKLVLNLARYQLTQRKDVATGTPFQFKVVRKRQGNITGDSEDLFLTSKTYQY